MVRWTRGRLKQMRLNKSVFRSPFTALFQIPSLKKNRGQSNVDTAGGTNECSDFLQCALQ